MAEKLSDADITKGLAELTGWKREGDEIVREFTFRDFVAAMGFIAQVGVLAERMNHHPNLQNTYNKVRIALSTHDAGGLTQNDFKLAGEISERA